MPLSTTNIRIVSVSIPYRSRIVSVSFPYRSPIILLSSSYHPPIILLLRSGKQYGNNTESNGGWTNEERWNKGGSSYYHCKFLRQWQDSNKLLWVSTCHLSTTKSDKLMQNMSRILNPLLNGVTPCDIPSLNGTGILCGGGMYVV